MKLTLGEGARITEALTAGLVVVVPERPVALGGEDRVGWWLVDPATGATADQMDDGRGVTMAEFARVLGIAACSAAIAMAGFAAYFVFQAAAEFEQGQDVSGEANVQAAKILGGGAGMAAGACGVLLT
jgi:hypothetical protein